MVNFTQFFKFFWPKSLGRLLSNLGVVVVLWLLACLAWHGTPFAGIGHLAERAAHLVDSGGAAIVHVSQGAAAAVHGGLAVSADFWHGVEITNVNMVKRRAHWVVEDPSLVLSWLATTAGQRAWPLHPAALLFVVDTLQPVSVRMPFVSADYSEVAGIEHAWQVAVAAHLLPSGYYRVALQYTNATFDAAYINPVWICSPISERQQILRLVTLAVNQTPFVETDQLQANYSVDELGNLAIVQINRFARQLIYLARASVSVALWGPFA